VNYFQIDAVRTKIDQAFSKLERPDLRPILTLGCCAEHDEDFDWYRHHTWQELSQEILTGWLDSMEFSALHPLAYHYFVPGILAATLESVGKDIDWYSFGGKDWLINLLPDVERAEDFRRDYLSQFSPPEIDAVASHLELFQQAVAQQRGYPDEDLTRAINSIWKRN